MNKLEKTLTELFSYTEFAGHINPKVSAVSVGWHIEHSMLVVLKASGLFQTQIPISTAAILILSDLFCCH